MDALIEPEDFLDMYIGVCECCIGCPRLINFFLGRCELCWIPSRRARYDYSSISGPRNALPRRIGVQDLPAAFKRQ